MTTNEAESLSPFTTKDAETIWRESIAGLLKAAYLQSFSQSKIDSARYKFPSFKEWWATLDNEQRKRVKGALAAFIL
ncbi:hypothetical protein [Desulfosediminicola ganghwensis]|uniref:hypothetical protein n=1 Tax=Desulfosediminicola ganghwensis TaxID=2569540 RepID=UPI0010AB56BE|nr:hypothetical protein [Desulfosediminicola ganghwensis]